MSTQTDQFLKRENKPTKITGKKCPNKLTDNTLIDEERRPPQNYDVTYVKDKVIPNVRDDNQAFPKSQYAYERSGPLPHAYIQFYLQ